MNKNEKYSELLSFVSQIAKVKCSCSDIMYCYPCQAIELVRRVTFKEDDPAETGEQSESNKIL